MTFGQRVKINKGQYKGEEGVVIQTTDGVVTVAVKHDSRKFKDGFTYKHRLVFRDRVSLIF